MLTLGLIVIAAMTGTLALSASASEYAIFYDDGSPDDGWVLESTDDASAVRFTPPLYPVHLRRVQFHIVSNLGLSAYHRAWVLDDDGLDGSPGSTLMGPVFFEDTYLWGWTEFQLPDTSAVSISDGSFYVAYMQGMPGFQGAVLGRDTNEPDSRSWTYQGGAWSQLGPDGGDLMIRVVVEVDSTGVPVEPRTWGRLKQLY